QDRIVRTMALIRMAAQEARTSGLEKQDAYKLHLAIAEKEAQLDAFGKWIDSAAASQKYRMVELQFLFLRDPSLVAKTPPGAKAHDAKTEAPTSGARDGEAGDLLKKLNADGMSDSDIEQLVGQKTELDLYKATAGYQMPECASCEGLQQSRFLLEPVEKAP